jgi:hypothetical protein
MNLFKVLKLPSSTKLHFHCVSENTSTHNDHLLLPVISAHFQRPAPVEFRTLAVALSPTGRSLHVASTYLSTSRNPQSRDFENDVYDSEEFLLSFDELPELGHRKDLLERVCKMLPISNVQCLSISVHDIGHPVNWVELFRRCTKVIMMQAIGRGTSSLVRALTTPKFANTKPGGKGRTRQDNRDSTVAQPARSTATPAQAPIFPNLMRLSLMKMDFFEEHPLGTLFDVVEKGLQQRRTAPNAPFKTLDIDDCAISATRAKALEKLVQGFYWDGEEKSQHPR